MTALLTIDDLRLSFGTHAAVKGLSFHVGRGETVALVGESGSGKSATALAILRLIEREGGSILGGRITLDGTPPLDLAVLSDRQMQEVRGNRISMIFQEPMTALNPVMRLGDQLMEALMLHQGLDRSTARVSALEAFKKVRIPAPEQRLIQFPHELSGGLRQRVMIAMALACRPDLLIADEPTTALDVTTQAEILALIRDLQAENGMAVLFITHDMGVVAEIADRIVVMRHGEKAEEGSAAEVFSRPKAPYTQMLMAASPRLGAGSPAPLPEPRTVLELEDIVVRFPANRQKMFGPAMQYHAVNGVSLRVGRGETLGLVGESGCGKSTLARAALKLIEPVSGRIRLEGVDITDLSPARMRHHRARAQMVFQDPYASLNPRLTVRDLITEPALIAGHIRPNEALALAEELLAKVGLERAAAQRYPHQFSGGQRQRLCIARALSVRPALIVADEAVSALDVSVARQITDLMGRLQQEEGISFLFISHDIAVVERVSHRIAVMYAGRIVEMGRTSQVLKDPRHAYTRQLLAAVPVPDPARRSRPLNLRVAASQVKLLLPAGSIVQPQPLERVSTDHWVATKQDNVPNVGASSKSRQLSNKSPVATAAE